MRKNLLLISLLLSSNTVFAATPDNFVGKALENYCIPVPNGDTYDHKPVCNSVFEGVYDGNKTTSIKCDCEVSKNTPFRTGDGKYLSYSTSLRRCAPKCNAGYYPAEKDKCQNGTYRDEITRSNVNTRQTKIFECTSCGDKSCSVDGMSCVSCVGNGVATCNPTNCAPVTCTKGYGLKNGKCEPCTGTTYSTGGTMACTSCGTGVSACNNSTGQVTLCSAGYGYSSSGRGSCSACTGTTYSTGGTMACTACKDVYVSDCRYQPAEKCNCTPYEYDCKPSCNSSCLSACRGTEYETTNYDKDCNRSCCTTSCKTGESCKTCYGDYPGKRLQYRKVNSAHSSCNPTGSYGSCEDNR